jgi:DnaJ-domain-containing protein 1
VVRRLEAHYRNRSKAIQVEVATIPIPCDDTLRKQVLKKFQSVNDKYEDLAVMIMERAEKEYSLLYQLPVSTQRAVVSDLRQWMETLDSISDTLEQHIGIQQQFVRNGRPE